MADGMMMVVLFILMPAFVGMLKICDCYTGGSAA